MTICINGLYKFTNKCVFNHCEFKKLNKYFFIIKCGLPKFFFEDYRITCIFSDSSIKTFGVMQTEIELVQ